MNGIARGFLISAVIYGLLGMALGLHMGLSKDHGQMPTHAHIMVLGWLSFVVFAMIYHQFSGRMIRAASIAHFVIAQVSAIVIFFALYQVYSGNESFDPVAGMASIGYLVSFVAFSVAIWPVMISKSQEQP